MNRLILDSFPVSWAWINFNQLLLLLGIYVGDTYMDTIDLFECLVGN